MVFISLSNCQYLFNIELEEHFVKDFGIKICVLFVYNFGVIIMCYNVECGE